MKKPFFQVTGLNVQAGGFKLKDISFSLNKDDYLIVLGPTGCGKTMLLETMAGLRKFNTGQIFLEERDITLLPPEARGLGFAYQDSLLYPFLNVKDNILFGARARKMHKETNILKRMIRLTEAMGISHLLQRFPKSLSGGEKQRVSLVRAILISPPVLLLDEPLSALDPQTRDSMRTLLQEIHHSEGLCMIHVTHDFNEALQMGTKLIVMNQGEILQQGKPYDVFHQPDSLFVANFLQCENIIQGKINMVGGLPWFKDMEKELLIGPIPDKLLTDHIQNEVCLLLQSGQLKVTADALSIDKPNAWSAYVDKEMINRTHVDLICKGSGTWHVALSRNEWQKLSVRVGSRVTLSVEMDHVHLIQN